MAKKVVFTKDMDATLRNYAEEGMTKAALSRALGVSTAVVERRARELSVSIDVHRTTEEDRMFIRVNFGIVSIQDMADKLGFTTATIIYWLREMGLIEEVEKREGEDGRERLVLSDRDFESALSRLNSDGFRHLVWLRQRVGDYLVNKYVGVLLFEKGLRGHSHNGYILKKTMPLDEFKKLIKAGANVFLIRNMFFRMELGGMII